MLRHNKGVVNNTTDITVIFLFAYVTAIWTQKHHSKRRSKYQDHPIQPIYDYSITFISPRVLIEFLKTFLVVKAETTLDYNVNITLPYFNFTFVFEITTIVNDFRFLSIENVQLGDISASVHAEDQAPSPMMYTAVEDNITSRAVLDFGKIKVSICKLMHKG